MSPMKKISKINVKDVLQGRNGGTLVVSDNTARREETNEDKYWGLERYIQR
jgi:hypothetical protein